MGLKQFLADKKTRENHLDVTIGDEEFRFHNIRVAALIEARDVIHDVAQAVSAFMDPSARSYVKSTRVEDAADPDEPDALMVSTTVEAISPVVAKARQTAQNEAVTKAVDALLQRAQMEKVAVLVLDSLRDVETTPAEFIDGLDVHEVVTFVKHTIRANMKVFGSLQGKAKALLAERFASAELPEQEKPETEATG